MQGKIETKVGIFVLAALSILLYMGFKIGALRLNKSSFASYTMYFKDTSGLSKKAEVQIAGVKVGWVENVALASSDSGKVRAETTIMINKKYKLYNNAFAKVRQDGLLGPKYIEIVPGDSSLTTLPHGGTLKEPTVSPVSVDELMSQFQKIATHVEDITESFKDSVGGVQGKEQLKNIFRNLDKATEKIASFSEIVDRSLNRNEDNIDVLLSVGNDIKSLAKKLENKVIPTFQTSMEKISDVFDRDFSHVSNKLSSTADAIEDASQQAREGMRSISSIAEKIDDGKGTFGKLVNDETTYNDLKVAAAGIKNYFAKVDRLQIVFDSHFEGMHRPAENYLFEDSKGYFNMRIHPNDDHFYMLQIVTSEKGTVDRTEEHKTYCDINGNPVDTDSLNNVLTRDQLENIFRVKTELFKRNSLSVGLQFGKIFNNLAFRFGLFENSAGVGVDYDIPFTTEKFRWVTTLEAFDLAGWNRKDDRRPHIKWINKVFMMKNLYVTFGADDFVSKRNANAFFGAGIRFGDNDIKYLLSSLGGASGLANTR